MDVIASPSYAESRRGSNATILAIWLAVALSACGPKAPPREPTIAPVTEGWLRQAEAEEKLRHYGRARLLYLRAKRESPDDVSRAHAAAAYASALIFWGELPAARRELREAIALRPGQPGMWHDLGHVEHKLGDDAAAEAALRTSIELSPRDPRSHVSLAALLVRLGRFDAAIAEYRVLLTLEIPDKVRAAIERTLPKLEAARGRKPGSASILQP